MDLTPTTAHGWSVIALHETGDEAVLFYANDTAGWIVLSLFGDVADASPGYTFA
jgi:hypothetical protein